MSSPPKHKGRLAPFPIAADTRRVRIAAAVALVFVVIGLLALAGLAERSAHRGSAHTAELTSELTALRARVDAPAGSDEAVGDFYRGNPSDLLRGQTCDEEESHRPRLRGVSKRSSMTRPPLATRSRFPVVTPPRSRSCALDGPGAQAQECIPSITCFPATNGGRLR